MGLSHGKVVHGSDNGIKEYSHAFDLNGSPPVLTANEVKILKEMWNIVKGDISKVGVITFVR
jgi:hypothetical protein